jgi:hypothetical protein
MAGLTLSLVIDAPLRSGARLLFHELSIRRMRTAGRSQGKALARKLPDSLRKKVGPPAHITVKRS